MESGKQRITLDISWEALLKVLAFIVAIWLAITLSEVIIMMVGVFIAVAAINPTVSRWQKYMSRTLAIGLFYSILIAILAIIGSVVIPSLVRQVNELAHSLPSIAGRIREVFPQAGNSPVLDQAVNSLRSSLDTISGSAFKTTLSVFGGIATVFTGLVISFYLLLEEDNAKEFFHQVLPQHRFEAVYDTVNKISKRMGMWVRGQLALMLIIGVADLILYVFIGIPSPLPLALWAGLCEALPYVGPIIGVLPALLVALAAGTVVQAILVVIFGLIVIQQLEAHVVVPKIMGKAVGLSPVLVILAIAVGVKIFGLVGAILAIPIAAIVSVVVGEWSLLRKIWETGE